MENGFATSDKSKGLTLAVCLASAKGGTVPSPAIWRMWPASVAAREANASTAITLFRNMMIWMKQLLLVASDLVIHKKFLGLMDINR